jgi:uncharacterized protein (DUF433 family)
MRTTILDERAERALIRRWIEPSPHRSGPAEAWLVESSVPVWAIVGYMDAVHGDIERAAADYQVAREAVEAALAYYRRHKESIDDRIAANALP